MKTPWTNSGLFKSTSQKQQDKIGWMIAEIQHGRLQRLRKQTRNWKREDEVEKLLEGAPDAGEEL